MYGTAITALNVDVYTTQWTNVYTITGQQQQTQSAPWAKATVNLQSYTGGSIKIRFRVIRGSGSGAYMGDIAIDDIVVQQVIPPSNDDPCGATAINVTTSCNYLITKEIEVLTNTPKILKYRTMIMQLLLGRCPDNPQLLNIAKEMGIKEAIFENDEYDDCILCGKCVRTCSEIVGANAITFAGRGITRRVEPPFTDYNDLCIACGACAFACPTGAVQVQFDEKNKIIDKWERVAPIVEVENCGQKFMPQPQIDYFKENFNFQIK
jgi:ferredoxin